MFDDIGAIRSRFTAEQTLDGRIDTAFEVIKGFGFDALIYDYTPVPYDLDGQLMLPSLLKLRNISEDMREYWFDREYFRIDPVQLLAMRTTTPFFWNYDRTPGRRSTGSSPSAVRRCRAISTNGTCPAV